MAFSGLYPTENDGYDDLKEALLKLQLNDASLTFEPERIARQVCDRALLMRQPVAARTGLFDVLLHPEISAHAVGAVAPARGHGV